MLRRTTRGPLTCVVALCAALFGSTAHAHSNGTVFSSPVDGDTAAVFWNPAAMALSPTSRFDLVANGDILSATYQRFGTDTAQTNQPFPKVGLTTVRPEPHIGIIIDKLWRKRLRLGFDVTVPVAGGAGWPRTLDQNGQQILGPTRYHVTSALLFDVYTQLGASIVVHKTLAIGVALNIATAHVDVSKDVDLANQPAVTAIVPCQQNPLGCENPSLSAPIHLSGDGVSAGASVGALWMPIPQLRVGASYISAVSVPVPLHVTINANNLNNFAQSLLPSFQAVELTGSGTTHIHIPQRANVAIAGDVLPFLELMAQLRWINYSASEVVSGTVSQRSSPLLPSALAIPSVSNDQFTFIGRAVGRIRDRGLVAVSVEYTNHGVPSSYMTPSNLDFTQIVLSLGGRLRLTDRFWLGATFAHTIVVPRTINKSDYSDASPTPFNLPDGSGVYTGSAERVGIDVSYTF